MALLPLNGDMDSDEESTRGQESSLDVSLAKRKTFPQESSSEGPLVKKSKPFCKRWPGLYSMRQIKKILLSWVKSVAPGRLCQNVRQQSALLPAGRPLAENFDGTLALRRSTSGGTCGRGPPEASPSICPAPRRETSSQVPSVAPWLIHAAPPTPDSQVQTPGPVSSTVNRQSTDRPPPPPSSQDASAAPWLIRAAPPTVAPPGLKITPGSQVQNPGPMSSIVNRQSIDLPPHHATSCADNLSGGSLQPDTRSLAVLHPRSPLPSTSGGAAAHSPHLPSSHRGDMQRLRLIIAEAGYILAGTQTGECSASPYGPGSGSGNKACTCCASLPMNQGAVRQAMPARHGSAFVPAPAHYYLSTLPSNPNVSYTRTTSDHWSVAGLAQHLSPPQRSLMSIISADSRSKGISLFPSYARYQRFTQARGDSVKRPRPPAIRGIVGGFVRTSPPWFRGAFHERQNRTERSPPISSLRPQWSEEDPWRFVNEENGLHRRAEPLKWHELNHAPPQRMCRR
ncbi:hypothetical protein FA13DRAFT_1720940 [Coprinellus micaceus]|uniref:Uncharacterized protein n=1 Tax=Coprinellus micaceus TaxID=71717 RepID=A0A4Y7S4N8_COPMI|nr:hypothetical protein FA13DRAFT_1720940 [Coprinellus micaceus]